MGPRAIVEPPGCYNLAMHRRRRGVPVVWLAPLLAAVSLAAQHGSDAASLRQAALAEARQVLDAAEQESFGFLLQHLPERDLAPELRALLCENVRLAHRARRKVAWGAALDEELFRHFVLPHVQASEERCAWRTMMVERFLPLVQHCRTPGEAALLLNRTIFDQLGVHYSTQRQRADQSPSESIAQGKASCTGLSILLADACRACCVPARLVSVRWPHQAGNHTWVEVWDGEAWRFVGADEPDPAGFDRAWFVGDAARCRDADRAHRIWAVSFAATGERFAAGWSQGLELWGIDVTARYAQDMPPGRDDDAAVLAQVDRWLLADDQRRAAFEFDRNLDARLLTAAGDAQLRDLVWRAILKHERARLQPDHDARLVRAGGKQSPFTVREVGEKPSGGWPLVIAMHGGGGVAKEVNDAQWRHMQEYYRDHPEASGYLYCALRAPTDEWNGFYTDYFYPLVEQLIRQFVCCSDVDPDRVIAIGYSHGGYGAFALATKLPDRFAAVHASAAAPTDGQTLPLGLHSLRFSFLIGGRDTAYGRRERCEQFAAELERLRQQHPGAYPTTFALLEDRPHTGLPDRDLLRDLVALRRCGPPGALRWQLTDPVVDRHYWLCVERPIPGVRFAAVREGARIEVTSSGDGARGTGAQLWLDAQLVPMQTPLLLVVDGEARQVPPAPSLGTLVRTMHRCGERGRAASWVVPVW
jgi:pimeloyl-ACP methyl ester carboxylesterase